MGKIKKLFMYNAGNYAEQEVDLAGSLFIHGKNNVGKSTALAPLVFFSTGNPNMGFESRGKLSYPEFYYPSNQSYIVYEVVNDEGHVFSVITYRDIHSANNSSGICFMFVDSPFRRDWIVKDDNYVVSSIGEVRSRIVERDKVYSPSPVCSYKQYCEIIYGNCNRSKNRNTKITAVEYQNFCFLKHDKPDMLRKTLHSSFINSTSAESKKNGLSMVDISHIFVDTLEMCPSSIDLTFFRKELKDFEDNLKDLTVWQESSESSRSIFQLAARAKETMESIASYEQSLNRIPYVVASRYLYIKDELKRIPVKIDSLNAEKSVCDEELKKLDIDYENQSKPMTRSINEKDIFLQQSVEKKKKYACIDLASVRSEATRKNDYIRELETVSNELQILRNPFIKVQSAFELRKAQCLSSFEQMKVSIRQQCYNNIEQHKAMRDVSLKKCRRLEAELRADHDSYCSTQKARIKDHRIFFLENSLSNLKKDIDEERFGKDIVSLQDSLSVLKSQVDILTTELGLYRNILEALVREKTLIEVLCVSQGMSRVESLKAVIAEINSVLSNIESFEEGEFSEFREELVLRVAENTACIDDIVNKIPDAVKERKDNYMSLILKESDIKLPSGKIEEDIEKLNTLLNTKNQKLNEKKNEYKIVKDSLLQKKNAVIAEWKRDLSEKKREYDLLISERTEARKLLSEADISLSKNIKEIYAGVIVDDDEFNQQVLRPLYDSLDNKLKNEDSRYKKTILELERQYSVDLQKQYGQSNMNEKEFMLKMDSLGQRQKELKAKLNSIEKNGTLLIEYTIDERDYFSREDFERKEYQLLLERRERLNTDYAERRSLLNNRSNEYSCQITKYQERLSYYSAEVKYAESHLVLSTFISGCGKDIKPEFDNNDFVSLSECYSRDSLEKNNKIELLYSQLLQINSLFSVSNTYKFDVLENNINSMKRYLAHLEYILSAHGEIQKRVMDTYSQLFKSVSSSVNLYYTAFRQLVKLVNEINDEMSQKNFITGLRDIQIRVRLLENNPYWRIFHEIKEYFEHSCSYDELFVSQEALHNNTEKWIRLMKSLHDLLFSNEYQLKDKRLFSFVEILDFQYRFSENNNTHDWTSGRENVSIGSEGTEMLIPLFIDVILLRHLLDKGTVKNNDAYRSFYLVVDEFGKLHPSNMSGFYCYAKALGVDVMGASANCPIDNRFADSLYSAYSVQYKGKMYSAMVDSRHRVEYENKA